MVCQDLGYASAASTESVNTTSTDGKFFKLRKGAQNDKSILSQFEKTDSCNEVVAITCQDFGKFIENIFASK